MRPCKGRCPVAVKVVTAPASEPINRLAGAYWFNTVSEARSGDIKALLPVVISA